MTMLNDEDLKTLQQEVQRLLGRYMLRLQQYERLIKAMVAHHKDFALRSRRVHSFALKP